MIPPYKIRQIEEWHNNYMSGSDYRYMKELLAERRQLVAIVEAIDKLRDTSLEYGTWYTGCPCEFAEDVDKALKAWKEGE